MLYQPSESAKTLTILQRIAKADNAAIENCIDTYGNPIGEMAKEHINSPEEAEALTREIFLDIWRYAGRRDSNEFDEAAFIALIARRRLIKYLSEKLSF